MEKAEEQERERKRTGPGQASARLIHADLLTAASHVTEPRAPAASLHSSPPQELQCGFRDAQSPGPPLGCQQDPWVREAEFLQHKHTCVQRQIASKDSLIQHGNVPFLFFLKCDLLLV